MNYIHKCIFVIILWVVSQQIFAQPFQICDGPGQNSCQCSTAPVICDIETLDGYSFEMSNYQHPSDGPTPMCPGQNNTQSNNPTWVAFIAWCTSLTIKLDYSNCSFGQNFSRGLQAAVYSNCNNLPGSVVSGGCGTATSGCTNNGSRTLNLTGLVPGQTYYLLVDGCGGSACDVVIDVIGDCNLTVGEIEETEGPAEVCLETSATYSIDPVLGAELYHWYLNGVNISDSENPSVTIPFTMPGEYELCVDISNVPCLEESADPPQSCFTIIVLPEEADAGDISITTSPSCPGETINFNVENYLDEPDFTEKVFITNEAGIVLQIFNQTSGSWTSQECAVFRLYSYNYAGSSIVPVVGLDANTIICNDCFCDIKYEELVFEDEEPPVFSELPPSQEVSCFDLIPPPIPLDWTDNCKPSSTADPEVTNAFTDCAGGTSTRTWSVSDACNNIATHTQVITILPVPAAAFMSVEDLTLDCEAYADYDFDQELTYSNNGEGECLIAGTQLPSVNDSGFDNCSGTIVLTWSATDFCNRSIIEMQQITVSPPPIANFIDVPDYTPIVCMEALSFVPPTLDYSNISTDCPIDGLSGAPQVVNNYNSCGGNISVSWNAEDDCGRQINAMRTIEVLPADPPAFLGTLPENITIACGPVTAYAINLNYANQNTGTCAIEGSIAPGLLQNIDACGGSALITWSGVPKCNFSLSHTQEITVEPSPEPYFVSPPPADITVSCLNVPGSPPLLAYTNGLTGLCGINGSATPNVQGTYDACGGVIVYDYSFTDPCGREISFTQTVTVSPAPPPLFQGVPLPSPINLPCGEDYPLPPNLNFSNGLSGNCGLSGVVAPTFIEFNDHREYTWSFINECTGEEVSVSQEVFLSPIPEATVFPEEAEICVGDSYDLSQLDITAFNGSVFSYTYYIGVNPTPQSQLPSPVVSPTTNSIYTIRVSNEFGCFDDVLFGISIAPDDLAGVGTSLSYCNGDNFELNFFSLLSGVGDYSGEWTDLNNSGVDLSDPYNVPFYDVPNGTYQFEYDVTSPQGCPQIPALLTITLLDAPYYDIASIICAPDLTKYTIKLVSSGFLISSSGGNIVFGTNDSIFITNIPAGQDVQVQFISLVIGCNDDFLPFTAPDCNCPFIPIPVSTGDKESCIGSPVPALSVNLSVNQVARWYSTATGGVPLSINNGIYIPTISNPGNFTFYVESLDTISNCPGLLRVPIILKVSSLLNLIPDSITICDNNHLAGYNFGRIEIKNSFYTRNNLPAFLKYDLYNSMQDAQNGINKITGDSVSVNGSKTIYFSVTSQEDCTSFSTCSLMVNPKPRVDTDTIVRPVCLGDSNGSVVFNLGLGEEINFNGSGYANQSNYGGLKSGSYKVGIRNAFGCLDSTFINVGNGLQITLDDFSFTCSNNGTLLNKGDDSYTFTLLIQNSYNKSGIIEITYLGNIVGTTNYGQTFQFNLPADGTSGDLIIKDVATGCTHNRKIGPLDPCSFPCNISATDLLVGDCNNNGTNNTGADDYFEVSFSGVLNGATGTGYRILVNGVLEGVHAYQTPVKLTLKANGTNQQVVLQDTTSEECVMNLNLQKPPCSKCEQTVEAGSDVILTCLNKTAQLVAVASSGGSYIWMGPGNFLKTENPVTISQPGKYIVFVSYADGCVLKDSLIVSNDAGLPFALAGNDQQLDCIQKEAVLEGTTNLTSNMNLIWMDQNGNIVGTGLNLIVNVPGIYSFEAVNTVNNCRSGKDTVIVTQNIEIPEAVILADPGNLLDCKVLKVALSAKDVPDAIFNWQTGEAFFGNTRSIEVSTEGVVRLFVSDTLNGCQNSSFIDILDIQDYPILKVDDPLPITCLNNGTYISAALSPQGPNLVFTWYDIGNNIVAGNSGDSLFVDQPGSYVVVLTDTVNNCFNSDTIIVERLGEFPKVTLPEDLTLYCGLINTSIIGQVISPVSPFSVSWKTDTGKILDNPLKTDVKVEGEGNYTMEVTYNDSGCKTSESIKINVDTNFPKAILPIVTDETCIGKKDGMISIVNISGGVPPYTYSINGAVFSNIKEFSPLNPGSYRLVITDSNGCKKDSAVIVGKGSDIQLTTLSPLEINYNQSKTLEVKTNLDNGKIRSVKWTPADQLECDTCLITNIQPTEDKRYLVVVTDIKGCEASATVVIRVKDNSMITVPNIINPNGSNNKYFSVYGNENVFNVESLTIYDRWGNLIYSKQNFKPNIPAEGWDGTFNSKNVIPGVYVYKVDYLSPSGIKTITGDVTVI